MLKKIAEKLQEEKWISGDASFKPSKRINIEDAARELEKRGYKMKHAESSGDGTFYYVTDKSGKTVKRSADEIKYFLTH